MGVPPSIFKPKTAVMNQDGWNLRASASLRWPFAAVLRSFRIRRAIRAKLIHGQPGAFKAERTLQLPLIQHPIDHHAGYGNVEPQRQRPARNLAMLVEPLFERTREGDQCQWEDDGR